MDSMETNKGNASNSDLKETLFGDDNVFCEICKFWIHGVKEIDKHFLIHNFKNWPMLSQNFNDVLRKKTENAAEYEKGLTGTANGINGTMVFKSILDNKQFGHEFNKYFEEESTEDGKDDDSVVTTVMDFPKNRKKAVTEKVPGILIEDEGNSSNILRVKEDDDDNEPVVGLRPQSQVPNYPNNQSKTYAWLKEFYGLKEADNGNGTNDTANIINDHFAKQKTVPSTTIQLLPNNPETSYKSEVVRSSLKCHDFKSRIIINSPSQSIATAVTTPATSDDKTNVKSGKRLSETVVSDSIFEIPNFTEKILKTDSTKSEELSQQHIFSTKHSEKGNITIKPLQKKRLIRNDEETEELVCTNEVSKSSFKTGKRYKKKSFENIDVPEKKPRFQKIQNHANAYIFNRNKNSKAVGVVETTQKQKQETNEPIKLNIKRGGDKLDRYTIIQPCATKVDEENEVITAKSNQKQKNVSFEDIEKQTSSMVKKKSISSESTDTLLKKSNKSSLQTEGGANFSKIINKSIYVTNSLDNIWPVQSYIEKKNATGVPISSKEQEELLLMFREMQYTKGKEPSRELLNAMRMTYKLRENEVRINGMPIRDSLKIFSGLKNYKLLKTDFETYTQKSLKVLNTKLKDLFEQLIDGEKFKPKVCGRFDVCEKAMAKLKKSPDDILMKKNVGMLIFGYKQTKGQWQDSLFKCRRKNDDLCIFSVYPFIDIIKEDLWTPNKKMDLYVERQEAGSVSGFYDAIISCYCMYWVFNLEYDEVVRPVFEYFDWIVGNPQSRYK